MIQPNVITITEAAKQKSCTRQALYNAIKRGDLDAVSVGQYQMIVRDEKFKDFQIKETGGKLHKRYLSKKGKRQ